METCCHLGSSEKPLCTTGVKNSQRVIIIIIIKNEWCMHYPESVLEYETHKLLWDFEIQTDHLISVRRPDLVIIKKERTCRIVEFAVPADHRVKSKDSEKKDKYLDLARELKKTVEHEYAGNTNCNWCSWYNHQRIDTGTVGLGNKKTSGVHPSYSFIKIGQNTEKSPGYLRRLAAIQSPVRKTRKGVNNNYDTTSIGLKIFKNYKRLDV